MNKETPNQPGMQQPTGPLQRDSFLHRRPVASYFALTFAVSWIGALFVAAPHLLGGQPLPKLTGILMFPAMLLGPSVVSIALTRLVDGPRGLLDLFSRMRLVHFSRRWYAALLIPPLLVPTVLVGLESLLSPIYAPFPPLPTTHYPLSSCTLNACSMKKTFNEKPTPRSRTSGAACSPPAMSTVSTSKANPES